MILSIKLYYIFYDMILGLTDWLTCGFAQVADLGSSERAAAVKEMRSVLH